MTASGVMLLTASTLVVGCTPKAGRAEAAPATASTSSSSSLVKISLARGSPREVATRSQLERLLKSYKLEPWLFTRTIGIDEETIPHSHPVLTLHTKHLKEDDQLLSTFIHEQLHWWMLANPDGTDAAVELLKKEFPDLPVGFPDGADSERSSYAHLPLIFLEYEGLRSFVGEDRANETFRYWEGDHYRALYRLFRENRKRLAQVVTLFHLVPAFLRVDAPELELATPRFEPDDPRARQVDLESKLDSYALTRLIKAAEASHSDSLVVVEDGVIRAERYFGNAHANARKPLETMSVTKSFVSLAIGFLLAEKKIPSLDTPLSRWFPEFASGGAGPAQQEKDINKQQQKKQKAKITLRHVLTHTTGIEHKPAAGVLTKQEDRLAYVRSLPVVDEPGTKFSYNNEAVQLLSGIISSAAGKPVDAYLAEKLFTPLGIREWSWDKDKKGNVATFYGLSLTARDLATVGVMLLAKGRFNDREIVPASWIDTSTLPARPDIAWTGMLWWIERDGPYFVQSTQSLSAYIAPPVFEAASKLTPLNGRKFESRSSYWMEAGALLSPSERASFLTPLRDDHLPFNTEEARPIGFRADGWLGQYLVVYPDLGIVAVRQHREPDGGGNEKENETYGFKEFSRLVRKLSPTPNAHSNSKPPPVRPQPPSATVP